MITIDETPLPEPPNPEQLPYRDVLTYYGSTMEWVQAFEHSLKCVLLIHRAFFSPSPGPVSDEDFERLFDETERSSLGRILNDLDSTLRKLNLTPFPTELENGLKSMVKLRKSTCAHLPHRKIKNSPKVNISR